MFKIIIVDSIYNRIIATEKGRPAAQQSYLYKLLCMHEKQIFTASDNERIRLQPEKVLKHPSYLYILDMTPDEALAIQQQYGVMCLSGANPDISPLIDIYDEHTTNEREQFNKGWDTVLDSIEHTPSNALILTDRYLFRQTKASRGNGFDNVRSILTELLPSTLHTTYHVTIVFFKDAINDEYTFDGIAQRLNAIAGEFHKPYPIDMEVLSITDENNVYYHLHNRRIISNYYIVKMDYTLAAFNRNISTSEQSIIPQVLFTEESLKKRSSPPLKAQQQIISALSNFSKSLSTSYMDHTTYLYAINGERKEKCSGIKNRLLK